MCFCILLVAVVFAAFFVFRIKTKNRRKENLVTDNTPTHHNRHSLSINSSSSSLNPYASYANLNNQGEVDALHKKKKKHSVKEMAILDKSCQVMSSSPQFDCADVNRLLLWRQCFIFIKTARKFENINICLNFTPFFIQN